MEKTVVLSLADAEAMALAAEAKAIELGLKIVVTIIDQHGNMKYMRRMDGTASGSVRVSQMKAFTAASFPFSTKQLAARSSANPDGVNPYGGGAIPGFLLLEGGEPIFDGSGNHLGGIGISGATPELDGQCARAGISALVP